MFVDLVEKNDFDLLRELTAVRAFQLTVTDKRLEIERHASLPPGGDWLLNFSFSYYV